MKGMGGNINQMMKQAQKMQAKMMKMQEELEKKTVEASSGGGMVKVVASGKQQIVSIDIDKEIVNPDDIEMLQDLVIAAVNNALNQSQEMVSKAMSQITGGMNIPGLM
ncbi:MAG: YbaB/EbfC family nucleoid-associated protein [Deltaproteobacteria bacterium]|nr:MAG: YbaB/EbfC family nucleoid-associated protein [Deltaproteobacteria bacterium]